MNKLILLMLIVSLFSCEEKKDTSKNLPKIQNEESHNEAKKSITKIAIDEDLKIEKTANNSIDNSLQNTKENLEPKVKNVLPKNCKFGDIEIEISNTGKLVTIKSNNEFSEEVNKNFEGIADAFIETDVDGNGYNEFYCISNTGDILAFTSYKNKSYGEITIQKKPSDFYTDCKKVKFWEAKNRKLSITFESNSGALNTVRYSLQKGEASYQLIAD